MKATLSNKGTFSFTISHPIRGELVAGVLKPAEVSLELDLDSLIRGFLAEDALVMARVLAILPKEGMDCFDIKFGNLSSDPKDLMLSTIVVTLEGGDYAATCEIGGRTLSTTLQDGFEFRGFYLEYLAAMWKLLQLN